MEVGKPSVNQNESDGGTDEDLKMAIECCRRQRWLGAAGAWGLLTLVKETAIPAVREPKRRYTSNENTEQISPEAGNPLQPDEFQWRFYVKGLVNLFFGLCVTKWRLIWEDWLCISWKKTSTTWVKKKSLSVWLNLIKKGLYPKISEDIDSYKWLDLVFWG